jgi:hypothetical protein
MAKRPRRRVRRGPRGAAWRGAPPHEDEVGFHTSSAYWIAGWAQGPSAASARSGSGAAQSTTVRSLRRGGTRRGGRRGALVSEYARR